VTSATAAAAAGGGGDAENGGGERDGDEIEHYRRRAIVTLPVPGRIIARSLTNTIAHRLN